MEINKFEDKLVNDIEFFLEKETININNTEHIIDIFTESKEKINDKLLIENINIDIEKINKFYNLIPKEYYEGLNEIKKYLESNFSWIVEAIDPEIILENQGKNIKFVSITDSIEHIRDYLIDENFNEENFEKINKSIQIINILFNKEEYQYLDEENQETLQNLDTYSKKPSIDGSENILSLLEKIKENIKEKNSKNETETTVVKEEIKEEVKEKLELHLPDIMNNLYKYFSKLFDRKRKTIEKSEILSLQHILVASNKFLDEHKEIYGDMVFEQFENLENHIKELDTENTKEFNEEEIKAYFDSFVDILKEISHIHKMKKL